MEYQDAIIELSRTPFDVAFSQGELTILRSTPQGWEPVEKEAFYGTWEEAVVKGAERVIELSTTKPKRRKKK